MQDKGKTIEQSIRETKEKYETLIQNIPDAIYSALPDETGTTTFMSPRWKDWTGYAPEDFYRDHETWPKCIHPEDREKTVRAYIEAIQRKGEFVAEYRVIHKDNRQVRYLRDHGIPIKDKIGKIIRIDGIVTDISERKKLEDNLHQAQQRLEEKVNIRTAELRAANKKLKNIIDEQRQTEKELKKSEEKYYRLIEQATDAIISVNTSGKIMGLNKRAEAMFGYSREEILGKSSAMLVAPKNREKQQVALKKLEEPVNASNWEQDIFEGLGANKKGEEFPVEFSFYTVEINGEVISTASVRDVSKRKMEEQKLMHYQDRLRALTSQLTLSEEKERRRFAEYLHDEIGQYLFASQLQIEQLKTSLVSDEQIKALDKVLDNIKQMLDNSRSLTFELSSPILYELGLEKALEWLAEHTGKQYNLTVVFEDDKQEKPLEDDMKIFLYQAVRELLTNVAKHAKIQKASVSVKKVDSTLQICVADNGVGFNASRQVSSDDQIKGFGLFRINERLEQLGGRFEIGSQPNHGTTITIVAPLSVNGVRLA